MTLVGSVAVLLPALTSPPPATVAVLITVVGALFATLTVSVRHGSALAPAAIAPVCVHEREDTCRSSPCRRAPWPSVRPVACRVTVTSPVVSAAPAFLTVIV